MPLPPDRVAGPCRKQPGLKPEAPPRQRGSARRAQPARTGATRRAPWRRAGRRGTCRAPRTAALQRRWQEGSRPKCRRWQGLGRARTGPSGRRHHFQEVMRNGRRNKCSRNKALAGNRLDIFVGPASHPTEGQLADVQLSSTMFPKSGNIRWTACPVDAVKSCTRRRRTPSTLPRDTRHSACRKQAPARLCRRAGGRRRRDNR